MRQFLLCLALIFAVLRPLPAFAGEGATIVFKSGAVVFVADGYKELVSGMRDLNRTKTENFYIEINLEGNSFFLNIAEIAVICRDRCRSLELIAVLGKERSR